TQFISCWESTFSVRRGKLIIVDQRTSHKRYSYDGMQAARCRSAVNEQ
ncbi:unnamed protein product, partial [Onchocerca flexuosa]|uniref:TauD domain-containing protein n=2 Tax=Onchocerca flexuosa TaxID=387005 RepID=A0A183I3Z9_9BILA